MKKSNQRHKARRKREDAQAEAWLERNWAGSPNDLILTKPYAEMLLDPEMAKASKLPW
jgi:hypothetical protein